MLISNEWFRLFCVKEMIMTRKKGYKKPIMDIIPFQQETQLLAGSGLNTPSPFEPGDDPFQAPEIGAIDPDFIN